MPTEFTKCIKNGGRVRTKELGNDKYMHVCYDKNGKSYAGEVLKKKKGTRVTTQRKEKSRIKTKESRRIVKNAMVTLADIEKLKAHFESAC